MLIGELCKRSGLSKDTIRHYEALGLLHSHPRSAGSRTYREYEDDSFERLELIALAKRLRFSLRELAPGLDDLLSGHLSLETRTARLRAKLAEIDQTIADLQAARDELALIVNRPEKDFVDERLRTLGLAMADATRNPRKAP